MSRLTWNIMGGIRTPFGRAKGVIANCPPYELARQTCEEAIAQLEINTQDISFFVLLTSMPELLPPYPSRLLARELGLKNDVVSITLGEGAVSPFVALSKMLPADEGLVLLAGVESASSAMGKTTGGFSILDRISINPDSMSLVTDEAEELSGTNGLTRKNLDSFALESHLNGLEALNNGTLTKEIVSILPPPDYESFVRVDQPLSKKKTFDGLSRLLPVKTESSGIVTFGNLAMPSDGACAIVLKPSGKGMMIEDVLLRGVPGNESGPAFAIRKILSRNNLSQEDISFLELHERSSAHVLSILKTLGNSWQRKVNKSGGSLALGDVYGASVLRHMLSLSLRLDAGKRGIAAAESGGLCGACLFKGEKE